MVTAGRAALAAANAPVAAVGLANQGETVLALGSRERPPALARDLLAGPARRRGDARAGGPGRPPAGDHRPAARSVLRRAEDDLAPRARRGRRRVTTTDAWLVHRLTGSFVTDAATASRTLLLDLERAAWSAEACAPSSSIRGAARRRRLCGAVGETTAFGGALPVAGLAVDQQAALFAEGCLAAGEAKCTYGTGAFLLATVGERVPRSDARPGGLRRVAARTADDLLPRRPGLHGRRRGLAGSRSSGWSPHATDLDELGPASDEAIFVPALAGLAAPFWDPEARGAWVGLSLATAGATSCVRSSRASRRRSPGSPRPSRPTSAARSSACASTAGSRARGAHASAGRSPADARRALSVAACDGARRRGARAARERRRRRRPRRSDRWAPTATFEPRMSADEAAERLARCDAAAEALDALVEDGGTGPTLSARLATTSPSSAPESSARRSPRACALRASRRAPRGGRATSAPARARRTPPSCTPASTRSPGRSRRGSCRAVMRLLRPTPRRSASRSSARARCWSRGTTSSSRVPGDRGERSRNGYDRATQIGRDELAGREPHLGPGALGALEIPDESIICPFTTPLAFATEAVLEGVHLHRERARRGWPGVRTAAGSSTSSRGALRARWVVNAAGLHADEIDRLFGHERSRSRRGAAS